MENGAIAKALYDKGWCVIEHFISDEFRLELLQEQQEILAHGQFRHAGIGKGEGFTIRPEIRSDKVSWMDHRLLTPLQSKYWEMMEALRVAINQRCFLGLRSYEAHFAMYPPGSFYLRHLDQFQSVKYRVVTAILYLNDEWSEDDGGALRMYIPGDNGEETSMDIHPYGGQLVVFLSGEIPHEVLETHKERISITGWFRDVEY
ncbi:2OG-Fe(II) oxygenase [Echinicola vietnamensis]|uniref:Putative proline hydroxylase n=1 Tax=Echinicola vietnamensis (strain DSM 17526 / LMG 23754 / KMM 6221) TaxID=926556 RepID=L0FUG5_ECHVK|nr:2OG-Fe(II) oxygenase [Echinicola vietnamensis]AGA76320.1 putative proline hydroxylase [Echinicola vietnamensis DSM 17526]